MGNDTTNPTQPTGDQPVQPVSTPPMGGMPTDPVVPTPAPVEPTAPVDMPATTPPADAPAPEAPVQAPVEPTAPVVPGGDSTGTPPVTPAA